MGITAFPFSSVIDVPTARILGRDDAGTGSAEALTNTEIFAILGTGTPSASTYLRGDGTWATVSAGVGGSTGSVDNAVLRADGTGGATLQASAVVIPDNFTSSPNATVNHASIQATGGTTNVSVSVVPKGSGAFSLQVPDGTTAGGNARGANAVDLQTSRSAATQVASGQYSMTVGRNNTASGISAIAATQSSVASGDASFAIAQGAASGTFAFAHRGTASGNSSFCAATGTASGGNSVALSGGIATTSNSIAIGTYSRSEASHAIGVGYASKADRHSMYAHGSAFFTTSGDQQFVRFVLSNKTTTNSAVTLFLDGSSTRLTIPSGKILHATVHIVGSKSDGTAVASYMRQVTIKNVGGTTSLVGTVNTIGTDEAASTSIAITADDTNDALDIAVTGIASETWRWAATVSGIEIAYGS